MKRAFLSLILLLATASSAIPTLAAAQANAVTVYLQPVDAADGSSITDACFVLVNASNEGCDQNGDGRISFQGIAPGSYVVSETKDAVGYAHAADVTIVVAPGTPSQTFRIGLNRAANANASKPLVHVALVTRDPANGKLLTGACYVIVNASIEGCDENGDGQVDFADVTQGDFTITQTRAPSGYSRIDDFEIAINSDPTQAFIIKQAKRQNDAGHRNVSIVLMDKLSGTRISGGNACVQIVGASRVGCDENGDGQIDFLDIPVGRYVVQITSIPQGYTVSSADGLTVSADAPHSIVRAYFLLTPN